MPFQQSFDPIFFLCVHIFLRYSFTSLLTYHFFSFPFFFLILDFIGLFYRSLFFLNFKTFLLVFFFFLLLYFSFNLVFFFHHFSLLFFFNSFILLFPLFLFSFFFSFSFFFLFLTHFFIG